jgi:hypothetical protein
LNKTEKGKPKYSVDNLYQCLFVYHMDWSLIEHGPQRWEAGDKTEWAIPPALKFILRSEVKWSELRWTPCGYRCYVHYGDLVLMELDYIVIISFGHILHCVCFNLYCGGFTLFCNVFVCVCVCVWVGFVMCGCLDNAHSLNLFGYPDWGFSVLFPQL